MDDDLATGEQRSVVVVQTEAVARQIARDGRYPTGDRAVEVLTVLRAETIERVVLEDLPLCPAGGGGAFAVADQQHEFAIGNRAEQPLDERGADEPGRAGDGDAFLRERLGDHG